MGEYHKGVEKPEELPLGWGGLREEVSFRKVGSGLFQQKKGWLGC